MATDYNNEGINLKISQPVIKFNFQGVPAPTPGGNPAWTSITGKPTTFPPATHTHVKANITDFPALGTAAALNAGTSASNIVQLDGSAKLPAVDGSQLTNLPAGGQILFDKVVTAGDYANLRDSLESGTYATVFIPNGTYTITDNEARPLIVHANCKLIVGQSKAGTIIDANTLSSITDVLYGHPALTVKSITIKNIIASGKCFAGQITDGQFSGRAYTQFFDCLATGFGDYAIGFHNAKCTDCFVEGVNTSCIGFRYCDYLTTCVVNSTAYIAFANCSFLVGCKSNVSYFGYYNCEFIFNSYARQGTLTYYGSLRLYGCVSHSGVSGFISCNTVIGCMSFGDTNGFDTCTGVIEPITSSTTNPFINTNVKLSLAGGATGTFTTSDSKTVTVTNGFITAIN